MESKGRYTHEWILLDHFCPKFGVRIKSKLLRFSYFKGSCYCYYKGKATLNVTSERKVGKNCNKMLAR